MTSHQNDLKKVRAYLEQNGFEEQDRLPAEAQLAGSLRLTRSRLRYCLNKLASEGLIWRHVGMGTYVGPRPVLLNGHLPHPVTDVTNPREIMETRLQLEPKLARLAALRGNSQQFREMDLCLEKLRGTEDGAIWSIWDGRLHRVIAQATGNRLLLALFEVVHSPTTKQVLGDLRKVFHSPKRMREVDEEHAAFAQAILMRRPDDAEELMRVHLISIQRVIFGHE